ncbi:MAG: sigma-70 family RNA polymerase sigma factor [Actinobacteria bacterium]|nr:sigma-70 family RNA polymerase sigma factor [Actinomycetota bacterium]
MAIASPIRSHERRGEHEPGEERAPAAPVTLEELWEHRDYVRAVSRRIVGDPATAEDVVQETYVRAMRHLDRLDRSQSLRAWLATVARRCSIDELRRQGRHALPMDELPDREARGPHELVDALVSRDDLSAAQRALEVLHPRERELLVRRVTEGRTMAELAAEEGSTVRAVESVLTRARAKLVTAVERGAAWVLLPLRPLWGALLKRRVVASLPPDADLPPAMGTRTTEMVAAGVAGAVLAASMLLGGFGDGDAARVDASGNAYRQAEVPALGTGRSGAVASINPAAVRRIERLLAAAIPGFSGLSGDAGVDADHPSTDPAPEPPREGRPPSGDPGGGGGAASGGGHGSGTGETSGTARRGGDGAGPRRGKPIQPKTAVAGPTVATPATATEPVTVPAGAQVPNDIEPEGPNQQQSAPSEVPRWILEEQAPCLTGGSVNGSECPGVEPPAPSGGGGGGEREGLLPVQ